MSGFGSTIRKLRTSHKFPLRTVADYLGIDQGILSRIERGERKATRKQVLDFARYFKVDKNNLLIEWLSDKVVYELSGEPDARKVMKVAEEKMSYGAAVGANKKNIIRKIIQVLSTDKRVLRGWLFGSLARESADHMSDVDVMIEVSINAHFSYFDLADIQHRLGEITGRKVDIGLYGSMRPGIWERVKNEMELIYER